MDNINNSAVGYNQLVDTLMKGIVESIQSSGRKLPSSQLPQLSVVECQWVEYASEAVLSHENGTAAENGRDESMNAVTSKEKELTASFLSPSAQDLRRFFPPLNGKEISSDGRTFLYAACLGLLFSERVTTDNAEPTPLSTFLAIASFLLDELSLNPNEPTRTLGACCRPPIHILARANYPRALDVLLSRGADANQVDEEGWTAFMACCLPDIQSAEKGGPTVDERLESLKLLLSYSKRQSELFDENAEHTAYVNAKNYLGFTALHYACEGLILPLIRCLLEAGADATLRTLWGQSCFGIIMTHCGVTNSDNALHCETLLRMQLENSSSVEALNDYFSFLEEERKALELRNLVENVLLPASRKVSSRFDDDANTIGETTGDKWSSQDESIVTALLNHLQINPALVFKKETFDSFTHLDNVNVYELIHSRTIALMPLSFLKVYCDCEPSNEDREIITCSNYQAQMASELSIEGVRHADLSILMDRSFCLHRERGVVARQLELLNDLIVGPLQRTFAFGIPSNSLLKTIVKHAPRIVEMGAGSGYWSYLLSLLGADVIAFDAHPPNSLESEIPEENMYFTSNTYFLVQQGHASAVFSGSNPEMGGRALLIVWPNNPDEEDNAHVAVDGPTLPPIWDLDCLLQYYNSGGTMVIFVGEREEKIKVMSGASASDCGFCASRKFQLFLREHFELIHELKCPQWWMKEDDVTLWKKK